MRIARLAALLIIPLAAHAAPAPASPLGEWRTFDDATGQESGAVRIFERNGALYGDVTAIADPTKQSALCTRCSDDRKDKPVLGLQIIRGLMPDGTAWDGGQILDPKTGQTYRCSLHLEDGGQKLLVRGYLGISLLGRTQTWLRRD